MSEKNMSKIIEAKPKFEKPGLVKSPSIMDEEVNDFGDGTSSGLLALV